MDRKEKGKIEKIMLEDYFYCLIQCYCVCFRLLKMLLMRDILCPVIQDNIYLRNLNPSLRDFQGLLVYVKNTPGNPEVMIPKQLHPEAFITAHLLMYLRSLVYKIPTSLEQRN